MPRVHPDRPAMEILNHVLGGSMTSRLFERVRERDQLAYSVWSATTGFDDVGALTVHAGTAADQVGVLVDAVVDEVQALRDGKLDAADVADAISSTVGSFEIWLEGTGARMGRLGSQLAGDRRFVTVDDAIARITEVTVDRVIALADAWLDPAAMRVAVVGPVKARDAAAATTRAATARSN
jgi:predicted Zn-dependent peptidase